MKSRIYSAVTGSENRADQRKRSTIYLARWNRSLVAEKKHVRGGVNALIAEDDILAKAGSGAGNH